MSRDLLKSHRLTTPEQVAARAEAFLKRTRWHTGSRLIVQEFEDARRGMPPFQENETNMLTRVRQANVNHSRRHRGAGFLDHNDIRTTRLYVTNYALFAQLVCRRAARLGFVLEPIPTGWSLGARGPRYPGTPEPPPPREAPHLAAVARLLQEHEGVDRTDAYFATICNLETV